MNIMNIKTPANWNDILYRFFRETGMTASLMDGQGNILLSQGERFPLCKAIRAHQEALTYICSQTNAVMFALAQKTMQPIIDVCEGGLLRVVVPLVHQGSVLGQVNACGLAPEDEEVDSFLLARQLEITEDEVRQLARSTPAGNEEELLPITDQLFAELSSGMPAEQAADDRAPGRGES